MPQKVMFIIGIILVLIGLLFVGPTLGLFSITRTWPVILLLLGIGFFFSVAGTPKVYGLLMPGAILTLSSLVLLRCSWTGDWVQMATLWPVFLISVAVGFFLMYLVGPKNKALLIPGFIIVGVGILAFLIFNYINFLFPILFLAGGLVLILLSLNNQRRNKLEKAAAETQTEPEE
ncbi:MAG: hypothetical protein U5R06_20875 [candidate division KSB1 bacterium]|nr:hypothetical protein [candidate division KSB1 bacterium]